MSRKPIEENILGICLDDKNEKKERSEKSKEKKVLDKIIPSNGIDISYDSYYRVRDTSNYNIKENKMLRKEGLRRCSKCHEIKELKWFGKKDKSRRYTVCRSCVGINAENRVLMREGLRRCKVCKRILSVLLFKAVIVRVGKSYRSTICNECFIREKFKKQIQSQ